MPLPGNGRQHITALKTYIPHPPLSQSVIWYFILVLIVHFIQMNDDLRWRTLILNLQTSKIRSMTLEGAECGLKLVQREYPRREAKGTSL